MKYNHAIAVNTRLLLKNKLEGMGRFAHEILYRLTSSMSDCQFYFFFDRNFNPDFIYHPNITPIISSPPTRHVFLYYIWMQYSVKPLLTKLKPDLFFSPDGLCVLGTQTKQIPVIHDLNFEHHPEFHRFWARKYYRYFFPRFARISHHILTVSEFSKNDISKTYSIPEDKISVIYNGVSEKFRPVSDEIKYSTKKKFTNGRNYFVYVGSLHPRKNINGLFKAFSEFKKQKNSNIALVLAGPVYWGMKEIYHLLTSLQLENDVIFTNRLLDEDLNNILASSLGLVYVPFYEGFGIPVIEAFAAGVPVITSNVTSLPEVAADAAFLVNPHNPREIAQCMHYIMENVNECALKIQKGTEQLKKFSWDESAKKTEYILRKFLL